MERLSGVVNLPTPVPVDPNVFHPVVDIAPAPPEENFATLWLRLSETYTKLLTVSTKTSVGVWNWPTPEPEDPNVFHPVVDIAPAPPEENFTIRLLPSSPTYTKLLTVSTNRPIGLLNCPVPEPAVGPPRVCRLFPSVVPPVPESIFTIRLLILSATYTLLLTRSMDIL
ncbi:MAG: hypothetical protein ACD_81C00019G0005 [uncultured bacterium]|nr:MAG: hypothetical protein ACD_81C00019G0005 [uncultured bacterium]